jgi:hypothetical protein
VSRVRFRPAPAVGVFSGAMYIYSCEESRMWRLSSRSSISQHVALRNNPPPLCSTHRMLEKRA